MTKDFKRDVLYGGIYFCRVYLLQSRGLKYFLEVEAYGSNPTDTAV